MYSFSFRASATPTAMASWPIPENHLLICPCRNSLSIFSSILRGNRIERYKSRSSEGSNLFLAKRILEDTKLPRLEFCIFEI